MNRLRHWLIAKLGASCHCCLQQHPRLVVGEPAPMGHLGNWTTSSSTLTLLFDGNTASGAWDDSGG